MKTKILQVLRETNEYVSGQVLCELVGVSRTAVWKAINQLREEGYVIHSVQNRGYCLKSVPDVLSREELQSVRNTKWAGHTMYYYEEIDSTNTEAKRKAEEGAPHGAVFVADMQVQGRGRRGRSWSSPHGEGIFFTILLRPEIEPANAPMLTLVEAMAAVKGIARVSGLHPMIKWPNDIVLNGKKIAGILTEMSAQIDYINHIVVGTGINVHQKEFSPELEGTATSIDLELHQAGSGKPMLRGVLLEAVLEEFEVYYEIFLRRQNLSEIAEEYNQYLVNRDNQVRVLDPLGEYEGQALGINSRGELQVDRGNTVVSISSGEVSVRGVYGYV